jgi:hypothetical protein
MDHLAGVNFATWARLLRDNRYTVHPRYWIQTLFLTQRSLSTSRRMVMEARRFKDQYSQVEVKSPIFLVGHWRAGTTLLHYILAQDEQFASPSIYDVRNPHTFLLLTPALAQHLSRMKPRKRPMDNMEVTPMSPGEDEFALSAINLLSPLIGWSFPRRDLWYDRYLSFRPAASPLGDLPSSPFPKGKLGGYALGEPDTSHGYTGDVSQAEIEAWKAGMHTFTQKATFKYQKPLLFKSPPHTARLRLLLELFPDARFIHLRRDPYLVFQSMRVLYDRGIVHSYLQAAPSDEHINETILRRYTWMYDAYFADIPNLPPGCLVDLRFEDLEKDKFGEVQKIYAALNIPGFAAAEPAIRRYIDSLGGYRKNVHASLPEALRKKIAQAWQRSFDLWNYPV